MATTSIYITPVSITVRRTAANVIEYTVVEHDSLSGDCARVWHANRTATFWGPHTGAPGRQVEGGARTLWRDDDTAMLRAFRAEYRAIRDISLA